MTQIVNHNSRQYRMEGRAYLVNSEHPAAPKDADWWEYQIDFTDAQTGAAIMEWDSFHETYNGAVSQRLNKEGAESALADFLQECANGDLMADLFPDK